MDAKTAKGDIIVGIGNAFGGCLMYVNKVYDDGNIEAGMVLPDKTLAYAALRPCDFAPITEPGGKVKYYEKARKEVPNA